MFFSMIDIPLAQYHYKKLFPLETHHTLIILLIYAGESVTSSPVLERSPPVRNL